MLACGPFSPSLLEKVTQVPTARTKVAVEDGIAVEIHLALVVRRQEAKTSIRVEPVYDPDRLGLMG